MAKLCEGRVCIVTGRRPRHRPRARADVGRAGRQGRGQRPRRRDRRRAAARPARPTTSSTRSWRPAARPSPTATTSPTGTAPSGSIQQAIDTFGGLDVLINNAGILRDRMLVNMTEAEWDAVIKVHLKGTFGPSHHAAAYWREQVKAGETVDGAHHQHQLAVGHLRQRRPDQLRRGQGRHRRVHGHRRHGARPLRRHRQRHRPGRPHPHDREPRHGPGRRGRQGEDVAPLDRARSSPGWRRRESKRVTGRVFDVSGAGRCRWPRAGTAAPPAEPVDDPAALGPMVSELVAEARPNANMFGYDKD